MWDRTSNVTGWSALLGERRGGDDVAATTAPGRAEHLTDLPPAFISVGSAEVFRDEAVAYASRIWAGGGVAELHVWPGGFHGFENFAPDTTARRGGSRGARRLAHPHPRELTDRGIRLEDSPPTPSGEQTVRVDRVGPPEPAAPKRRES